MCTHNSKNTGSEPAEDQMPVSLVATRFHLVEGMCKLKTRTHMGKLAATWENVHPQKAWNAALFGPILPGHARYTAAGQCTAACLSDGTQRTRFQKADQTAGKRCRNGCVNCKSRASRPWTKSSVHFIHLKNVVFCAGATPPGPHRAVPHRVYPHACERAAGQKQL